MAPLEPALAFMELSLLPPSSMLFPAGAPADTLYAHRLLSLEVLSLLTVRLFPYFSLYASKSGLSSLNANFYSILHL